MFEKSRGWLLLYAAMFLVFSFAGISVAVDHVTDHFVISSDLDPCFIDYAGKKAELCYNALLGTYFEVGWSGEPSLVIYYSEYQSQSQNLMLKAGFDAQKAENGYIPGADRMYIFRLYDDGNTASDSLLFGGIARHFIEKNYRNELAWFKKELGAFLSKSFVIVNGNLKMRRPVITCCAELQGLIDQETISDHMRNLLSSSLERYNSWTFANQFSQLFFSWLYDRNNLKDYLFAVRTKGHRLKTLVECAGISYGEIKTELISFIDNYCQFQKKIKLFEQADDPFEKEHLIEEAYGFVPDANDANLALAQIYYEIADYTSCLRKLQSALDDMDNVNNWQALKIAANVHYRKKEYAKAVLYYEKLWNISDYYEYRYRIAYQIANCYYYQNRKNNAKKWYEKFLEDKWLLSDMPQCRQYAMEFLQDKGQRDFD